MKNNKRMIYFERCAQKCMMDYPFFIDILTKIQSMCNKREVSLQTDRMPSCPKCRPKYIYRLGNIVWEDTISHKISNHKLYPSEYFINVVTNCKFVDNYLINPPIKIKTDETNRISFFLLHYNKLLIIDALMKQGSFPRYISKNDAKGENTKYIHSEHCGAISIKDNIIDSIIVSTDPGRIDPSDDSIYLPNNIKLFAEHCYIFHTHPNTISYGGRIGNGIIYEFPSANDILNFVKYYTDYKLQSSIVVTPEGTYVIRPISYDKIDIPNSFFHSLQTHISKVEKLAISELKPASVNISDPDVFHSLVSNNIKYIRLYNKFIKRINLFVEFYARVKKNDEWQLQDITLFFLKK